MATKSAEPKAVEKTFDFPDALVKKAADLIAKQGYVSRKEISEMQDLEWAVGFGKKVDRYFLDADAKRYIYTEKFDFAGGEIDAIIWDMDQITTREAALEKLAEVLGKKVINGKLDQVTY
ncbi:hypothetical protein GPK34_01085 [Secundilactobacillus kimchicus]|uniref:Uncharacterized protein n=1 Tax=Secundilactobacillus kimchicus JCM 15530 TaxID=1302272 RepID=A0A0R1HTQ2_9LACO|nr:hypothetical protein [Secundilactobacillus kimchicus]KRK46865.1 hypothetical protein FC96_GL000857 [Secundilactobacillus kimchicus JCM 15530]MBT9670632.1 hypothetical protein [Secundilactobacillus kimchicus]